MQMPPDANIPYEYQVGTEILETASDREIAHALGWPINCEIPRRSEIEDMGIIRCVGEQFDSTTQRTVMIWSVA